MREKVKIGDRWIGQGEPTFIIAEVGANHDRKIDQAKKLIDVASEARADAVKFQSFKAEMHVSSKERDIYESKKLYELPREWLGELATYAQEKGLTFICTPFDREVIDQLAEIGVPAYKWASPEIVDLPLLKYAAGKGKPMIISTGMSNLADIQEAVEAVYSTGNEDIILLHCVSLYPAKPNQVNLRMMDTMKQAFQLPVGFSDHTSGITIPIAAVARGACVIEKHFTLSRKLKGPDHPFALEPEELKQMVRAIREVAESLGSPIKRLTPEEEIAVKLGRRSIIASIDIPKGTRLTQDMLTIKRPGYGIRPKFLDIIIGREAKKDIEQDEIITWEMV
jgi:sialic acid synthase SpsE